MTPDRAIHWAMLIMDHAMVVIFGIVVLCAAYMLLTAFVTGCISGWRNRRKRRRCAGRRKGLRYPGEID